MRLLPPLAGRPGTAWGDISGALADLGVFVPLAAALVIVNGLNASGILISAGMLYLAVGGLFRIPFPVQPLKALTAVAVAGRLGPGIIHAAGLEIGIVLLILSVGKVAGRLASIFEKPVVRSLQVGVGLLLLKTSVRLLTDPPAVFAESIDDGPLILLATVTLAGLALAAWARRYTLLVGGAALALGTAVLAAGPQVPYLSFTPPAVALPSADDFARAFFLLVIPQIPLTFGNAVVAVTDLAKELFGPRAHRVTPRRVCLSAGFANLAASVAGGMPMCHGAGGLTAHFRLGARSPAMNIYLGSAMLVGGFFFSPHIVGFFGLLPVWTLAALLAYAGIRHCLLAFDLRGYPFALALVAGVAGAVSGNLSITTVVALALHHGARFFGARAAARSN